jgi:hypothetical protein
MSKQDISAPGTSPVTDKKSRALRGPKTTRGISLFVSVTPDVMAWLEQRAKDGDVTISKAAFLVLRAYKASDK